MKKKRGKTAYSDEFRREAVRLAETKARCGIGREGSRRAPGESAELVPHRGAAAGASTPGRVLLEEENRRLRKENKRLKEEREILKKATAFFARDER